MKVPWYEKIIEETEVEGFIKLYFNTLEELCGFNTLEELCGIDTRVSHAAAIEHLHRLNVAVVKPIPNHCFLTDLGIP